MLARMRITALIPEAIVNSIYRSILPMQALAQRGHTVHLEERNEIRDARALLECDLVHFLRFAQQPMQRMARALRDAGVAVVWDNDDNLTASQKGNPNYAYHSGLSGQRVLAGMTTMMRHADVVTTPSTMLAERYRELSGADVRVLENYLPPAFTRPARVMPHNGVTIGWLAALEHQRDVEQLGLQETLGRLLARHQQLELITIGLNLGLASRRYRHVPITNYGELPELLTHFDIGIAPIAAVDFNRGRSNVKLKEYAAMGVPWLASPVGGYEGMGEEQGGRLVPDDRWYEELERLLLDADDRSRLALRARRWAQEQTIERHAERWEQTFEDAIERARAGSAVR
jgi:glycosyltransferase involved in cell wall biosynthesis